MLRVSRELVAAHEETETNSPAVESFILLKWVKDCQTKFY